MAQQKKFLQRFDQSLLKIICDHTTNKDVVTVLGVAEGMRQLLIDAYDSERGVDSEDSALRYYAPEMRRIMSLIDMIESDALMLADKVEALRARNRSYKVTE